MTYDDKAIVTTDRESHVGAERDEDIDERCGQSAEQTARLLGAAIGAVAQGVVITDREGRILWVNAAFEAQTGYSRDEAVGNTPRVLKSGMHPDEFYENLWKTVLSGSVWRGEIINRRKDGSLYTEEMTITPIRLDGKGITHLVALKPDITSRKLAEEERLQMERRLLDTQRLESLGVLAGGIAHRYNNLLTTVIGNLDLAAESLPLSSPARLCIAESMEAAMKAADLTRQMLAYSGKGRLLIQRVDLNSLIPEIVALLGVSVPGGATLDIKLAAELPPILADPGQMQQIVMNLVTNASEAISGDDGEITIATGVVECDAPTLARSRVTEIPPPGRFVFLDVSDTGSGMDDATLRRIFEPFFTTKFTGRGLGLSAVQGIVRGHGGAMFVESAPGAGTRIRVLIPAVGDRPESRAGAQP